MTDQSFDPHDATADHATEDELFTKEVLATFMDQLIPDGHASEGPPPEVQEDLLRALDEQSREASGGQGEGDASTAPPSGRSYSRSMLALAASVITVAASGVFRWFTWCRHRTSITLMSWRLARVTKLSGVMFPMSARRTALE